MAKKFFLLLWALSLSPCASAERPESLLDEQVGQWERHTVSTRSRATPSLDVESYALEGEFDWGAKKLLATVDITFRIPSGATALVLDSEVSRVLDVSSGGRSLPFHATPKTLSIPWSPSSSPLQTVRIRYEAAANREEGTALLAVSHRAGDPVPGRVVATVSEPLGVAQWMPCHNSPSDRARFAVDLTMPQTERLIANGDLVRVEKRGEKRHMAYRTRYSLPTYLMAFAVGDFEASTVYHGSLPISLWHRRGLQVDTAGLLRALRYFMVRFEQLLVPYPFEKYALVLLPEFTGGLEHAGIAFQGETVSSQATLVDDLELAAHELAHQWFGDLVTILTWDDLWIKEGMATLLAQEALRFLEDQNGTGRLMGNELEIRSGEAIIDPALQPDDKYTSGPYDRAAWWLTQVRSVLGEQRFWRILAHTLWSHRYGVVSTDEFLTPFQRALGSELFEKAKRALKAKEIPSLGVSVERAGEVTFRFTDPESSVFTPLQVVALGPSGEAKSLALASEGIQKLAFDPGTWLVLDPEDRHPVTSFAPQWKVLSSWLVPQESWAWRKFFAVSSHHQRQALQSGYWTLSPEEFFRLFTRLASESARYRALQMGCQLAKKDGAPGWKAAIERALERPPVGGLSDNSASPWLSSCRFLVGSWLSRWDQVALLAEHVGLFESDWLLLSLLSTELKTVAKTVDAVLSKGGTIRAKKIAVELLGRHLLGQGDFELPQGVEEGEWRQRLHRTVASVQAGEVLRPAVETLVKLKDTQALPSVATAVRRAMHPKGETQLLCAAVGIAADNAEAWDTFVRALGDAGSLSVKAQAVLKNPALCTKDLRQNPTPSLIP